MNNVGKTRTNVDTTRRCVVLLLPPGKKSLGCRHTTDVGVDMETKMFAPSAEN
jgi:hypothetical protein